ncbi:MAG: hypothetical protein WC408_06320 [Candidatus Micrarchaeia archaeon]|jgi:hypothetical protein
MDSEGLRSRFRGILRGQGATEYLVILGAVLLVSLVVVSLTSASTSSQVSMKQQQSQAYWSSLSPIKVLSSKVVDSNLVLQVQNTGTSTIRLDGVNVGGTDLPIYPYYSGDYYGSAYCSKPYDNFSATMTCALMVGAGESVYVAVQGAGVVDCGGKTGIELSNVQFAYSLGGSSITNIILKGDKPLVTSCGVKACDVNWVKVPGNSSFLVNDFCLMKYEAKQSGVTAISNWSGTPWISINQTYASDRCSALGSGYHLIRDREWNVVANNVAGVASNWFTPNAGISAGTGRQCLFGGHMQCDASGNGCYAAFNASSDDGAGWWNGTTNASVSATATCPFVADEGRGFETRRTFYLSTGDVIWDLSGNVWEWTDGAITSNACSDGTMPVPCTSSQWLNYSAITNFMAANWTRLPNPVWNSTYGTGNIYVDSNCAYGSDLGNENCGVGDHSTHAFLRGGTWNSGAHAGAWALTLNNAPSNVNAHSGFRCAR